MVAHRLQCRFQSSLHFDNTRETREGQGISIYFSPKSFRSFQNCFLHNLSLQSLYISLQFVLLFLVYFLVYFLLPVIQSQYHDRRIHTTPRPFRPHHPRPLPRHCRQSCRYTAWVLCFRTKRFERNTMAFGRPIFGIEGKGSTPACQTFGYGDFTRIGMVW